MRTGFQKKKYALIALFVVFCSLSISVAFITYRYFGVVARGISGFVLLYLLIFGEDSKADMSIGMLVSGPKRGKYFVSALTIPLVSYWAMAQIYEMVLFFWRR